MPTSVRRFSISEGDAGIIQTVERMAEIIRDSLATPIVREAATSLTTGISPKDSLGQCYAIREWLASSIVFLRDPAGVELLHTSEWLLRTIAREGVAHVDCDDAAILGGSLAGAIGLRVILVTVAFLDKSAPMSHVWASASKDDSSPWIEFDVTRPMQDFPVEMISRSRVFPVC